MDGEHWLSQALSQAAPSGSLFSYLQMCITGQSPIFARVIQSPMSGKLMRQKGLLPIQKALDTASASALRECNVAFNIDDCRSIDAIAIADQTARTFCELTLAGVLSDSKNGLSGAQRAADAMIADSFSRSIDPSQELSALAHNVALGNMITENILSTISCGTVFADEGRFFPIAQNADMASGSSGGERNLLQSAASMIDAILKDETLRDSPLVQSVISQNVATMQPTELLSYTRCFAGMPEFITHKVPLSGASTGGYASVVALSPAPNAKGQVTSLSKAVSGTSCATFVVHVESPAAIVGVRLQLSIGGVSSPVTCALETSACHSPDPRFPQAPLPGAISTTTASSAQVPPYSVGRSSVNMTVDGEADTRPDASSTVVKWDLRDVTTVRPGHAAILSTGLTAGLCPPYAVACMRIHVMTPTPGQTVELQDLAVLEQSGTQSSHAFVRIASSFAASLIPRSPACIASEGSASSLFRFLLASGSPLHFLKVLDVITRAPEAVTPGFILAWKKMLQFLSDRRLAQVAHFASLCGMVKDVTPVLAAFGLDDAALGQPYSGSVASRVLAFRGLSNASKDGTDDAPESRPISVLPLVPECVGATPRFSERHLKDANAAGIADLSIDTTSNKCILTQKPTSDGRRRDGGSVVLPLNTLLDFADEAGGVQFRVSIHRGDVDVGFLPIRKPDDGTIITSANLYSLAMREESNIMTENFAGGPFGGSFRGRGRGRGRGMPRRPGDIRAMRQRRSSQNSFPDEGSSDDSDAEVEGGEEDEMVDGSTMWDERRQECYIVKFRSGARLNIAGNVNDRTVEQESTSTYEDLSFRPAKGFSRSVTIGWHQTSMSVQYFDGKDICPNAADYQKGDHCERSSFAVAGSDVSSGEFWNIPDTRPYVVIPIICASRNFVGTVEVVYVASTTGPKPLPAQGSSGNMQKALKGAATPGEVKAFAEEVRLRLRQSGSAFALTAETLKSLVEKELEQSQKADGRRKKAKKADDGNDGAPKKPKLSVDDDEEKSSNRADVRAVMEVTGMHWRQAVEVLREARNSVDEAILMFFEGAVNTSVVDEWEARMEVYREELAQWEVAFQAWSTERARARAAAAEAEGGGALVTASPVVALALDETKDASLLDLAAATLFMLAEQGCIAFPGLPHIACNANMLVQPTADGSYSIPEVHALMSAPINTPAAGTALLSEAFCVDAAAPMLEMLTAQLEAAIHSEGTSTETRLLLLSAVIRLLYLNLWRLHVSQICPSAVGLEKPAEFDTADGFFSPKLHQCLRIVMLGESLDWLPMNHAVRLEAAAVIDILLRLWRASVTGTLLGNYMRAIESKSAQPPAMQALLNRTLSTIGSYAGMTSLLQQPEESGQPLPVEIRALLLIGNSETTSSATAVRALQFFQHVLLARLAKEIRSFVEAVYDQSVPKDGNQQASNTHAVRVPLMSTALCSPMICDAVMSSRSLRMLKAYIDHLSAAGISDSVAGKLLPSLLASVFQFMAIAPVATSLFPTLQSIQSRVSAMVDPERPSSWMFDSPLAAAGTPCTLFTFAAEVGVHLLELYVWVSPMARASKSDIPRTARGVALFHAGVGQITVVRIEGDATVITSNVATKAARKSSAPIDGAGDDSRYTIQLHGLAPDVASSTSQAPLPTTFKITFSAVGVESGQPNDTLTVPAQIETHSGPAISSKASASTAINGHCIIMSNGDLQKARTSCGGTADALRMNSHTLVGCCLARAATTLISAVPVTGDELRARTLLLSELLSGGFRYDFADDAMRVTESELLHAEITASQSEIDALRLRLTHLLETAPEGFDTLLRLTHKKGRSEQSSGSSRSEALHGLAANAFRGALLCAAAWMTGYGAELCDTVESLASSTPVLEDLPFAHELRTVHKRSKTLLENAFDNAVAWVTDSIHGPAELPSDWVAEDVEALPAGETDAVACAIVCRLAKRWQRRAIEFVMWLNPMQLDHAGMQSAVASLGRLASLSSKSTRDEHEFEAMPLMARQASLTVDTPVAVTIASGVSAKKEAPCDAIIRTICNSTSFSLEVIAKSRSKRLLWRSTAFVLLNKIADVHAASPVKTLSLAWVYSALRGAEVLLGSSQHVSWVQYKASSSTSVPVSLYKGAVWTDAQACLIANYGWTREFEGEEAAVRQHTSGLSLKEKHAWVPEPVRLSCSVEGCATFALQRLQSSFTTLLATHVSQSADDFAEITNLCSLLDVSEELTARAVHSSGVIQLLQSVGNYQKELDCTYVCTEESGLSAWAPWDMQDLAAGLLQDGIRKADVVKHATYMPPLSASAQAALQTFSLGGANFDQLASQSLEDLEAALCNVDSIEVLAFYAWCMAVYYEDKQTDDIANVASIPTERVESFGSVASATGAPHISPPIASFQASAQIPMPLQRRHSNRSRSPELRNASLVSLGRWVEREARRDVPPSIFDGPAVGIATFQAQPTAAPSPDDTGFKLENVEARMMALLASLAPSCAERSGAVKQPKDFKASKMKAPKKPTSTMFVYAHKHPFHESRVPSGVYMCCCCKFPITESSKTDSVLCYQCLQGCNMYLCTACAKSLQQPPKPSASTGRSTTLHEYHNELTSYVYKSAAEEQNTVIVPDFTKNEVSARSFSALAAFSLRLVTSRENSHRDTRLPRLDGNILIDNLNADVSYRSDDATPGVWILRSCLQSLLSDIDAVIKLLKDAKRTNLPPLLNPLDGRITWLLSLCATPSLKSIMASDEVVVRLLSLLLHGQVVAQRAAMRALRVLASRVTPEQLDACSRRVLNDETAAFLSKLAGKAAGGNVFIGWMMHFALSPLCAICEVTYSPPLEIALPSALPGTGILTMSLASDSIRLTRAIAALTDWQMYISAWIHDVMDTADKTSPRIDVCQWLFMLALLGGFAEPLREGAKVLLRRSGGGSVSWEEAVAVQAPLPFVRCRDAWRVFSPRSTGGFISVDADALIAVPTNVLPSSTIEWTLSRGETFLNAIVRFRSVNETCYDLLYVMGIDALQHLVKTAPFIRAVDFTHMRKTLLEMCAPSDRKVASVETKVFETKKDLRTSRIRWGAAQCMAVELRGSGVAACDGSDEGKEDKADAPAPRDKLASSKPVGAPVNPPEELIFEVARAAAVSYHFAVFALLNARIVRKASDAFGSPASTSSQVATLFSTSSALDWAMANRDACNNHPLRMDGLFVAETFPNAMHLTSFDIALSIVPKGEERSRHWILTDKTLLVELPCEFNWADRKDVMLQASIFMQSSQAFSDDLWDAKMSNACSGIVFTVVDDVASEALVQLPSGFPGIPAAANAPCVHVRASLRPSLALPSHRGFGYSGSAAAAVSANSFEMVSSSTTPETVELVPDASLEGFKGVPGVGASGMDKPDFDASEYTARHLSRRGGPGALQLISFRRNITEKAMQSATMGVVEAARALSGGDSSGDYGIRSVTFKIISMTNPGASDAVGLVPRRFNLDAEGGLGTGGSMALRALGDTVYELASQKVYIGTFAEGDEVTFTRDFLQGNVSVSISSLHHGKPQVCWSEVGNGYLAPAVMLSTKNHRVAIVRSDPPGYAFGSGISSAENGARHSGGMVVEPYEGIHSSVRVAAATEATPSTAGFVFGAASTKLCAIAAPNVPIVQIPKDLEPEMQRLVPLAVAALGGQQDKDATATLTTHKSLWDLWVSLRESTDAETFWKAALIAAKLVFASDVAAVEKAPASPAAEAASLTNCRKATTSSDATVLGVPVPTGAYVFHLSGDDPCAVSTCVFQLGKKHGVFECRIALPDSLRFKLETADNTLKDVCIEFVADGKTVLTGSIKHVFIPETFSLSVHTVNTLEIRCSIRSAPREAVGAAAIAVCYSVDVRGEGLHWLTPGSVVAVVRNGDFEAELDERAYGAPGNDNPSANLITPWMDQLTLATVLETPKWIPAKHADTHVYVRAIDSTSGLSSEFVVRIDMVHAITNLFGTPIRNSSQAKAAILLSMKKIAESVTSFAARRTLQNYYQSVMTVFANGVRGLSGAAPGLAGVESLDLQGFLNYVDLCFSGGANASMTTALQNIASRTRQTKAKQATTSSSRLDRATVLTAYGDYIETAPVLTVCHDVLVNLINATQGDAQKQVFDCITTHMATLKGDVSNKIGDFLRTSVHEATILSIPSGLFYHKSGEQVSGYVHVNTTDSYLLIDASGTHSLPDNVSLTLREELPPAVSPSGYTSYYPSSVQNPFLPQQTAFGANPVPLPYEGKRPSGAYAGGYGGGSNTFAYGGQPGFNGTGLFGNSNSSNVAAFKVDKSGFTNLSGLTSAFKHTGSLSPKSVEYTVGSETVSVASMPWSINTSGSKASNVNNSSGLPLSLRVGVNVNRLKDPQCAAPLGALLYFYGLLLSADDDSQHPFAVNQLYALQTGHFLVQLMLMPASMSSFQQAAATLLSAMTQTQYGAAVLRSVFHVYEHELREFCTSVSESASAELQSRPAPSDSPFAYGRPVFGIERKQSAAPVAKLSVRNQTLLQLVLALQIAFQSDSAATADVASAKPTVHVCMQRIVAPQSANLLAASTAAWQASQSGASADLDLMYADLTRTKNRTWPYDVTLDEVIHDIESYYPALKPQLFENARATFIRICNAFNAGNMQRDILIHSFLNGDTSWRRSNLCEFDALFEFSNPGYGEGAPGLVRAPNNGLVDIYDAVYLEASKMLDPARTMKWWDWAIRRRKNADGDAGDFGEEEPERPAPCLFTKPYPPMVDGVVYGCKRPGLNPSMRKDRADSSPSAVSKLALSVGGDLVFAEHCFNEYALDDCLGAPGDASGRVWASSVCDATADVTDGVVIVKDVVAAKDFDACKQSRLILTTEKNRKAIEESSLLAKGSTCAVALVSEHDIEHIASAEGDVCSNACVTQLAKQFSASQEKKSDGADVMEDIPVLYQLCQSLRGVEGRWPPAVIADAWITATRNCAVVESAHPMVSKELREVIQVKGAQALSLRFDAESKMRDGGLCITITSASEMHVENSSTSGVKCITIVPSAEDATPTNEGRDVLIGLQHLLSRTITVLGDSATISVTEYKDTSAAPSTPGAAALPDVERDFGWGFRCYGVAVGVPAVSSFAKVLQHRKQCDADLHAASDPAVWTQEADTQLMSLLADLVDTLKQQQPSSKDISVDKLPLQLVTQPTGPRALEYPLLAAIPSQVIRLRAAIIRAFNACVIKCLPLLRLDAERPSGLARMVIALKHIVSDSVKKPMLEMALSSSKAQNEQRISTVKISRSLIQSALPTDDLRSSKSLFAQLHEQLTHAKGASFRLDDPHVFNVAVIDDVAVDTGGVYRDTINQVAEELCSDRFTLFTKVPRVHTADAAFVEDLYAPNLAHFASEQKDVAVSMMEVVGRLLGVALRTRASLPFAFANIVWKALLEEELTFADVQQVCPEVAQLLQRVRDWTPSSDGDAETSFAAAFPDLTFTVVSPAGHTIELMVDGASVPVTAATREQFVNRAVSTILGEYSIPLQALRRGFGNVVPWRLLNNFFTVSELQRLVCGSPNIDPDILRRNTTYAQPFHDKHPVIEYFWEVFRSLRTHERSQYLQFVSGKSRLPQTDADWGVIGRHQISPLTLKSSKAANKPDQKPLPTGHTCFFRLELPEYFTDAADLKERLLVAVANGLQGGFGMH